MENSTKKIICDALVMLLAFLGLFLKKTEATQAKLTAADEVYIRTCCDALGLHLIKVAFKAPQESEPQSVLESSKRKPRKRKE